jgi:hypothetical protein
MIESLDVTIAALPVITVPAAVVDGCRGKAAGTA